MINKDYGKVDAQQWMNRAGRDNRPFLFAVNYACTDCRVWPLDEVPDDTVLYKIGAETNLRLQLKGRTIITNASIS